tara:strand:+ start:32483 stop:33121 length:639 start_codon:yes stop_codon:yes gene_type:complete
MYSWFNELTRIQKPNREKKDYYHYDLYEVEILNSLFRNHNVKSVLSLGGMSNLDFFLAQYDNDVKTATNIDEAETWRPSKGGHGFNLEDKQQEYIQRFKYNGEYIFTKQSIERYDVVDRKYDVVFCNIDTLKGKMKVLPDIFIKMWSFMGLVDTTRERMTTEYEEDFSNVLVTTNMTVFSNKKLDYEVDIVPTSTKLSDNRIFVYKAEELRV